MLFQCWSTVFDALTVITLSSVGHFWLEKRLSHSIARLFAELSEIDTATSTVMTWSAHDMHDQLLIDNAPQLVGHIGELFNDNTAF